MIGSFTSMENTEGRVLPYGEDARGMAVLIYGQSFAHCEEY
jgi:hypothetical protein